MLPPREFLEESKSSHKDRKKECDGERGELKEGTTSQKRFALWNRSVRAGVFSVWLALTHTHKHTGQFLPWPCLCSCHFAILVSFQRADKREPAHHCSQHSLLNIQIYKVHTRLVVHVHVLIWRIQSSSSKIWLDKPCSETYSILCNHFTKTVSHDGLWQSSYTEA